MDTIEASRQLTENLYYIVGVGVISGLGSIIAAVSFAFKKVIWISRLEFRLERVEKDLNAAFDKIRADEVALREVKAMRSDMDELARSLRHTISSEKRQNDS
jgi:threonine dehydrogenase-like Zn-dependent dehydrogenase